MELVKELSQAVCLSNHIGNNPIFGLYTRAGDCIWCHLSCCSLRTEIIGNFNNSMFFNYTSYRNLFPVWALEEFRRRLLAKKG
uniref:Uncharacterized protein n=1 Tax=Oryza brachyantha TaxID=4533 RepID=J3N7J0_ORYBR